MKLCGNCAWYCHSNQACWGNGPAMNWGHYLCFPKAENSESCEWWQSDGLEEWEREACRPEALMTMAAGEVPA